MTSHGHGIARATRPRTEEQRQADLDKIARYRTLEDDIRDRVSRQDYDQDTFSLTSKLLRQNPEYYTVWNIRRRCLTSGSSSKPWAMSSLSKGSSTFSATGTSHLASASSSPPSSTETPPSHNYPKTGMSGTTAETTEDRQMRDLEIIKSELVFTVPLLMEFPKCYWIWNYRLWTLGQAIVRLPTHVARKVWEEELGLVGKMLHRDRRNFHAWGYRRYVVDQLESAALAGQSMTESEFEYTTKMIRMDLSNFSAWHYRSQLIPRLLRERDADDQARQKFLDDELAFIRDGLNVGPEDQSLWFYHQFLASNIIDDACSQTIAPALSVDQRRSYIEREIDEIKDLLEDYTDVKWIYEALIQYTQSLSRLGQQAKPTELKDWLAQLKSLDPQRTGRWNDLEAQLYAA
ncbi:uncharacterized protein F5Z01DRAFT_408913 [Emericellopsis atlantica]|uniref:Geranylgeranyl transferase type-2 subunit alpha n=1 Tax=Emericellopsis atlantica TaxID=2614577 RepID=A0A9P8CSR6_9HYPO|nr:uncharacterized protein F5Z01DRAFT_408913 [Emericellopsis atlantica]KAG9257652.1 hypothetical protein F5Z01DRAFT_408913 [Emericellopsis atlantica]